MTRSGSGDRRLIRRSGGMLAAGAVLALGVAAVGVRAAAGAALRNTGLPVGAALGLALLFAVVALITAGRYRNHVRVNDVSTSALDRLRQATVAILFASAVLVPFALVLLHRPIPTDGSSVYPDLPTPGTRAATASQPAYPTRHPQSGRHFAFDLTSLLWALFALAGLALFAVLVLVAIHLLRNVPVAGPTTAAAPIDGVDGDDEALADALQAGRGALEGDDARAAIIACYAAMEASLGEFGVARERADSPSDLLRRATKRDLPGVGAQGAATLTALFREARFSTHPMTAQHLASARGALDSVTVALAERMREHEEQAARGAGTEVGAP